MSDSKQAIREAFRSAVFKRDGWRCRVCLQMARVRPDNGLAYMIEGSHIGKKLDAHHITDRTLMPNGGYVVENGIALCPRCHELAERFHSTGVAVPHYSPDDLYALIRSSEAAAVIASEALGRRGPVRLHTQTALPNPRFRRLPQMGG